MKIKNNLWLQGYSLRFSASESSIHPDKNRKRDLWLFIEWHISLFLCGSLAIFIFPLSKKRKLIIIPLPNTSHPHWHQTNLPLLKCFFVAHTNLLWTLRIKYWKIICSVSSSHWIIQPLQMQSSLVKTSQEFSNLKESIFSKVF